MPFSYSDACVHVGICESLDKEGQCWQRGHNQALNGQPLTHHTQTHTHKFQSPQLRSIDIQTQAANQHVSPQPQRNQSMSSEGDVGIFVNQRFSFLSQQSSSSFYFLLVPFFYFPRVALRVVKGGEERPLGTVHLPLTHVWITLLWVGFSGKRCCFRFQNLV